ncbi:MAG: hypothetical protein DBX59_00770 [Bacillota bacterium]|nr:MAG: hypothetical protein DBX59_00770 [Bacillota bacterium]
MINNKIARNSAWLIGGKIVQSLLSFVIGLLTARYLGPADYGLVNYAASIVAFVLPIMYLGINNILVQELVTAPEKEGTIIGTASCLSFISSFLCIGGILAFVSVINAGEKDAIVVCALYSVLLIFQSFDMIQYWFQSKLLSKYTSVTALSAYVVVAAYKTFLLVTGKSVYWFAISNALDYFIIALISFIIYKKLGGQKFRFSAAMAKKLLYKGKYYIISGLMVTIFAETDKIMIKLMIDNTSVGYYGAAVTIAGISAFVFSAIIDSFRPVILGQKGNDEQAYRKNMKRLYCIVIYLALLQSVVIALLARYIVLILYGAEYAPAVGALRIIVWYTTFSYLGAVRNVWILAEGKHRYLWIINLSGALCNIALNLLLIPLWGISGAAAASLITQFFTNVLMGYIIKPIWGNNKLMLQSLNPKILVELFRGLKSKKNTENDNNER